MGDNGDIVDAGGWSDDHGTHQAYFVQGGSRDHLLEVLGGDEADVPSVRQSTGPNGAVWFELWRWEGAVRTSAPGAAAGPAAVRDWLAALS